MSFQVFMGITRMGRSRGNQPQCALRVGFASDAPRRSAFPKVSGPPRLRASRSLKRVLRDQAQDIVGKIEAVGPGRSKDLRRGHTNEEPHTGIRTWAK